MPLAVVILVGLFAVQSRGTARVATFFGPLTLSGSSRWRSPGCGTSAQNTDVLSPSIPSTASSFLLDHGVIGFVTLGAVFLGVTGAEALYADLGHFGTQADPHGVARRRAAGAHAQLFRAGRAGARRPEGGREPVLPAYPEWALLPMVLLATAATVIASQAVITGAYSLTQQAVQLGLLPRLEIRHTSAAPFGQIYMPRVNFLLLDRRAAAGPACSARPARSPPPMASPSPARWSSPAMMAFIVCCKVWRWPLFADGAADGAVPRPRPGVPSAPTCSRCRGRLDAAGARRRIMVVMYTWRRGSRAVREDAPARDAARDAGQEPRERSRRRACRAPRSFSPATRPARRPRCCTASSTTRCCTRRTSS